MWMLNKMIKNIHPGINPPKDINVIIEIPAKNKPIKYEYDTKQNILKVDRFMTTTMQYPCNYGFIPRTIAGDGDAIDVLVITPTSLITGTMINCRPLGILKMHDESGNDDKILAVPNYKLTTMYDHIKNIKDYAQNDHFLLILLIANFFSN